MLSEGVDDLSVSNSPSSYQQISRIGTCFHILILNNKHGKYQTNLFSAIAGAGINPISSYYLFFYECDPAAIFSCAK